MADNRNSGETFTPAKNAAAVEAAQNDGFIPPKTRRKSRLDLPEIVVAPLDERESASNPMPSLVGIVAAMLLHVCLLLTLALLTFPQKSSRFPGVSLDGTFTETYITLVDDEDAQTGNLHITSPDVHADPVPEPLTGEDKTHEDPLPAPETAAPDLVPLLPDDTRDPANDPGEEYVPADGVIPSGSQGANAVAEVAAPRAFPDFIRPGMMEKLKVPKFPTSGTLIGRTDPEARGNLLKDGGTPDSEQAVLRGLRWLEAHQQMEQGKANWGSWNFDMRLCPGCQGKCGNSGEETSTTAATALALLAMLGYGETREQGEFRGAVQKGLYYLSTKAVSRKNVPGYDLRAGGDMYTQALCSLALSEAYIMERAKDPQLENLAQGTVDWLLWAQNPETGGWRYMPKQPGDLTVTTWVLMALKSGKMAGSTIPSPTMVGMERFLQSVSSHDGAQFAYLPDSDPIRSTTSVGLFAKMFTGSPREAKFLDNGTALLSQWGYSPTDLYYNYYASMVMRHYGGVRWQKWNEAMRDYLVATQEFRGHETGSWYFDEPDKTHNRKGGRLYTTVMAIMTLEVYYRYMPIYKEETVERKML